MKKNKKFSLIFLILILAVTLCFSLTGCESNRETNSNNIKISLVKSQGIPKPDGTSYVRLSVLSDYVTEDSYVWEVNWSNPDSVWSKDKLVSDYIVVNVVDQIYSSTVDVLCKQAFSEKIVITCALESNLSVNSSCICDYEKRILGFELLNIGSSEIDLQDNETRIISNSNIDKVEDDDISYSITFSDYTIEGDESEFEIYIRLTDNFIDKLGELYLTNDVVGTPAFSDPNMIRIDYTGDLVFNALNSTTRSLVKTYYDALNAGVDESVLNLFKPTKYLNILSSVGSNTAVGHIVIARSWYSISGICYETLFEYPIYIDSSLINY